MREKISACITAGNEEKKIRRCLESVSWCDEIVVVDSFSTDRTAEICREYTDRVYQHEWLGYIGSKNLIRGMATHPWLLYLDADEEISSDLRDEILREFNSGSGEIVGYRFPRLVHYLGRWIKHGEWYPDYKLRLFRKDAGSSDGEANYAGPAVYELTSGTGTERIRTNPGETTVNEPGNSRRCILSKLMRIAVFEAVGKPASRTRITP